MRFRVIDIETVPDLSVWRPSEPKYALSKMPGDFGKLLPHPHLEPSVVPIEEFPPPQAHRVVAIARVDIDWSVTSRFYQITSMESLCGWSHESPGAADLCERTMLRNFVDHQDCDKATLVSWNGRGFDLPVISMRCLKHGIPCGWYYDSRDIRYRYTPDGHLDLMDYLGDYGAARNMKLGDMARLIGLPGKVDITGASVADIHREGDVAENVEKVRRYCLQDTFQTAVIFVRSRLHLGKLTTAEYNQHIDLYSKMDLEQVGIEIDWNRLKVAF